MTLLAKFKTTFPDINWPEDITSSEKSSYNSFFLTQVLAKAKELKQRQTLLSYVETALVIFAKRLAVEFKPTVVTKKTKLKIPKKNAIVEIDCSEPTCAGRTAIWLVKGETVFTEQLKLCCTVCQAELSEVVEIVKKPEKPKKTTTTVTKKPKKPTKKQLEEVNGMNNVMKEFEITITDFSEEEQILYANVQAWLTLNQEN